MTDKLKNYKVTISAADIKNSGGTFGFNGNSGIPYLSKTAGADTPALWFPLIAPSAHESGQGLKLKSIEIPIRATTQNFNTTPTFTIYRRNMLALSDASVDNTASTLPCTLTGATVTANAKDRLLTISVTTPALDYDTEDKACYWGKLALDAGTSTALRIYDAIAYYEVTV